MKQIKYVIPSLFTVLAMMFAFYAVLEAFGGRFTAASYGVIAAMIFDSLDGRSARLLNACTPFGASLDSLADMMAYGVAPAIMLYCWGLYTLDKTGYLVCFIFCACAGLRLARFNIRKDVVDKRYFQGLSSTIAGGFIVSFILTSVQYQWYSPQVIIFAAILMVVTALLMVSNIKFYSFKAMGMSKSLTMTLLALFIVVAVILLVKFKGMAFFIVLGGYILIALLLYASGITSSKK